jgi:hypothetical protein
MIGAGAAVATDGVWEGVVGGEEGLERKSATRLANPGRWDRCTSNSDRKERCRCWQEEKRVEALESAETRVLLSVKSVKGQSSREKRKWRRAR